MSARRAAGILLALAALMGLLACLGSPSPAQALDDAWHDRMAAGEAEAPVALARALDWIGGWRGTTIVGALAVLVLVLRKRWRDLGLWVGAILVAEGASQGAKLISGRLRPTDALGHAIGSAFPSGHTTVAATVAILGVALFVPQGRPRRIGFALALVYVVAVAWSRTYLRVHWLSDVTAGALLGTAVALLAISLRVSAPDR